MTEPTPRRVCVVGAGVAGLAAALALRTDPTLHLTVLDAAPAPGGKLATAELAGVPVDDGAESFLARDPDGVRFAADLGLAADLVHPAPVRAAVWARGRLRPIPGGTVLGVPARLGPLARSGVLTPVQLARAAAEPLRPGRLPEADVAVGTLVTRRFGPAVTAGLVDPLLGGVYAGRADLLSFHATMAPLAAAAAGGRSLRAAAHRIAPAATGDPVFVTVRGGLGRLVDVARAALTSAGVDLRTGRAVRALARTPTGWRVTHGATVDAQTLDVDAVVLALPPSPAARLLADPLPRAAAALELVDSASVAVVALAFPAADAAPQPGSGYLVPASSGRPVKAVTFLSTKWPHLADTGHALVRCSFGRFGDVADLQRDDTELIALARAELARTVKLTAAPVDARVHRWGGALPQYTVGHLDRVAAVRAAVDATCGLAVCGATYQGVGVPACIRSGEAAAAKVRADLGE